MNESKTTVDETVKEISAVAPKFVKQADLKKFDDLKTFISENNTEIKTKEKQIDDLMDRKDLKQVAKIVHQKESLEGDCRNLRSKYNKQAETLANALTHVHNQVALIKFMLEHGYENFPDSNKIEMMPLILKAGFTVPSPRGTKRTADLASTTAIETIDKKPKLELEEQEDQLQTTK